MTTEQAAKSLGCTANVLLRWLHGNPGYKPINRYGHNYNWSPREVERVRRAREETASLARHRAGAKS